MERPTKMEETTNHSWLEANVFFSYFWLHLKKVWKYLTVSFFIRSPFFLEGHFQKFWNPWPIGAVISFGISHLLVMEKSQVFPAARAYKEAIYSFADEWLGLQINIRIGCRDHDVLQPSKYLEPWFCFMILRSNRRSYSWVLPTHWFTGSQWTMKVHRVPFKN